MEWLVDIWMGVGYDGCRGREEMKDVTRMTDSQLRMLAKILKLTSVVQTSDERQELIRVQEELRLRDLAKLNGYSRRISK